jgi:hypothetical protein
MKVTKKCPKCSWEKEYEDQISAEYGLRMHINRKHGSMKGQPPKRKYTKQEKLEPMVINFCCECGANVRVQNRAALMTKRG